MVSFQLERTHTDYSSRTGKTAPVGLDGNFGITSYSIFRLCRIKRNLLGFHMVVKQLVRIIAT